MFSQHDSKQNTQKKYHLALHREAHHRQLVCATLCKAEINCKIKDFV